MGRPVQKSDGCAVTSKALYGKSFLAKDLSADSVLSLFKQHVDVGVEGIWVTRSDPFKLHETLPKSSEMVWLSSSDCTPFKRADTIEELKSILLRSMQHGKAMILLERFDYLLNKHGVDKVIDLLYQLNDRVLFSKSTMILNVSSASVPAQFLAFLEQEFEQLDTMTSGIEVRHDLLQMIEYVSKNPYCEIGKTSTALNITRTTARKRILELNNMSLISVMLNGRKRALSVTEKGKAYCGAV